ncbi:cupredoxin family protein [Schlegelella sp. S2-27]|uniref:Cupredoxin family protein n=2 Tax=Caldimonas mangrovi TaxID=2944811 RepID=A0ABT0YPP5_9BURK|nr:cupredoxin family protein [Caldimonas mangrovi]MCM5680369.1 cupredoxin family protein [Caldimonas mangrovi]
MKRVAAVAALVSATGLAVAHGDDSHRDRPPVPAVKEQQPWGIAGDAKTVTRTIEVRMLDTMRFSPERIDIREGETVRFIHRNDGKVLHEFVLGTKQALDKHAELMMKFPDMEHDEPHMIHVRPGKAGDMVWTFNRAGEFDFACLIPGHYQAGMVGKVKVLPK